MLSRRPRGYHEKKGRSFSTSSLFYISRFERLTISNEFQLVWKLQSEFFVGQIIPQPFHTKNKPRPNFIVWFTIEKSLKSNILYGCRQFHNPNFNGCRFNLSRASNDYGSPFDGHIKDVYSELWRKNNAIAHAE